MHPKRDGNDGSTDACTRPTDRTTDWRHGPRPALARRFAREHEGGVALDTARVFVHHIKHSVGRHAVESHVLRERATERAPFGGQEQFAAAAKGARWGDRSRRFSRLGLGRVDRALVVAELRKTAGSIAARV